MSDKKIRKWNHAPTVLRSIVSHIFKKSSFVFRMISHGFVHFRAAVLGRNGQLLWRAIEIVGLIAAAFAIGLAMRANELARSANETSNLVGAWSVSENILSDCRRTRVALEALQKMKFTLEGTDVNLGVCSERVKLIDIQLPGANLQNSSFAQADLGKANFQGAQLNNTDFSLARLTGADFSEADLKKSNFSAAALSFANFSGAILQQANFSGAQLCAETIANSCTSGLTQSQLSKAWSWSDDLPRGLSNLGLEIGIVCPSEGRSRYENSDKTGLPEGCPL